MDTPPSLKKFQAEHGFDFGFISDHRKTVIERYGVRTNHEDPRYRGVAEWAVFVVNSATSVTYTWKADEDVERFTTGEIVEMVEQTS